jgi:hypothetical protein
LRRCGIEQPFDLFHPICRKTAQFGMLQYHVGIRRNIDAIELVLGKIAVNPLYLLTQLVDDAVDLSAPP